MFVALGVPDDEPDERDQRTADECAWITERVGEQTVLQTTLNPVLTGFQAGKIIWLRRHEPENYARVRHVLLPKDYLRLRLTDGRHTDPTDACGTLLFDITTGAWSPEIVAALGLDPAKLVEVVPSDRVVGTITAAAATATHASSMQIEIDMTSCCLGHFR